MNYSDVDRRAAVFQPQLDSVDALMQQARAAQAVPEKFEAAVREFAEVAELDPEALIEGQTFQVGSVPFNLLHYGAADPGAATVVVDLGEFPQEGEAALMRGLLEHNMRTPAGRHGCFGLAPGSNRMLYCIRVDLENAENGAEAIGNVIKAHVETMHAMLQALSKKADALQSKAPSQAR